MRTKEGTTGGVRPFRASTFSPIKALSGTRRQEQGQSRYPNYAKAATCKIFHIPARLDVWPYSQLLFVVRPQRQVVDCCFSLFFIFIHLWRIAKVDPSSPRAGCWTRWIFTWTCATTSRILCWRVSTSCCAFFLSFACYDCALWGTSSDGSSSFTPSSSWAPSVWNESQFICYSFFLFLLFFVLVVSIVET